jgi:predicted polyphosphate/ATP-dependent NAD kinase
MASIRNAPQSSVKIGFLVNPIAGMGGAVGLKGTDGADVQAEAVRRGALAVAPGRAVKALISLRELRLGLEIVTCGGEMGASELRSAEIEHRVVYEPGAHTSREDTIAALRSFMEERVKLVIFAGGDGTARDVLEVIGDDIPILGVPAGVKMHSAVFLNRPEDLGPVVSLFARGGAVKDADVLDIDEDSFRSGTVCARLYGIAKVPDDKMHVQSGKMAYGPGTAQEESDEIGQYIADSMEPRLLYIIGPGSTTAAIARCKGFVKTLLGVDVVRNGEVIKADASEADLLEILDSGEKAKVIVSPIGSQGFVFGRGNQQISSRVLDKVRPDDIVIVATPTKLQNTRVLRVDTGDGQVDDKLRGMRRVVTGYKRRRLVRVR